MLLRRIDELHMSDPFAGSRMLRDMLSQQGLEVGRHHVRTLMRLMCIEAFYRRPNTSKLAPSHKIYFYPLRVLSITRPNQVWVTDIIYVSMARLHLSGRGTVAQTSTFSASASSRLHKTPTSAITQDTCYHFIKCKEEPLLLRRRAPLTRRSVA